MPNQLLTRGLPVLPRRPPMIRPMKLFALHASLTAVVLALGAAGAASAATSQYEGTVVSVNRDNRTFRLHDAERGTIRIKVTRSTSFEDLAGFRSLHAGIKRIEAVVRRSNGRWVASHVERAGGGGSHGGSGRDHPEDD
jgi:hypothetical protein